MRQGILSALIFFCTSAFAQSYYYQMPQTGNPGGINRENDQESENGGGWVLIMDSAAKPSYSSVQQLPIGFDFHFAGQPVTHFKVSSTGFLTFDTLAANTPITGPEALPSNNLPNKTISIWGLGANGGNDKVICKIFGNPPNRQFWVKFYSMSTPGDSLSYTYWSMVLEEGTHNIYLVSMNHGAVRDYVSPKHMPGIQISASKATKFSGSPNFVNTALGETYKDNFYICFIYGTQPTTDVFVMAFQLPVLTLAGNNNPVKMVVKNEGSQVVTSLKLNYQVNSGTIQSFNLSGLNILPSSGSMDTLMATGSISATTPGDRQLIKAWVSDVNGGSESNKTNDSTVAHTTVYSGTAPRADKVLFEYATGAWCADCPPAEAVVEKMKKQMGDTLIAIAHHTLDGMALPVNSLVSEKLDSFPSSIVNRSFLPSNHQIAAEGSGSWISTVRNATQKQRWADISIINLQLDTHGLLTWKIKVRMLDYAATSDLGFGSVVVEDNIRGNGQAYDQQIANKYIVADGSSFKGKSSPLVGYYHQNVPVSSPTGIWGSPVVTSGEVLKPGDSFEWNMSYRFDKLLKKEFMAGTAQYLPNGTDVYVSGKPIDMRVVGFLALSGQSGDRTVLSVTQAKLWDVNMKSSNVSRTSMRLYPNPAEGQTILATGMPGDKRVILLTAPGRIVREFTAREADIIISTENLSDGIYYLQCIGGAGSSQVTMLVRH
ncbi:MAG: T9SS type A sorting domain-containing protein [Bacteroidetes bacterium]|nr:T9SS type A sorting domain-containing protein [Bacteroidota bacterium]